MRDSLAMHIPQPSSTSTLVYPHVTSPNLSYDFSVMLYSARLLDSPEPLYELDDVFLPGTSPNIKTSNLFTTIPPRKAPMLAIQHPRMGSSQLSDGAGPFGFSFNGDDFPFLEAPEPAPGEPLLSRQDGQAIHDFFSQINSSQYNNSFEEQGLNFSAAWHQLPPQFMGHSTTYGQHPPQALATRMFDFPDTNFHDALLFGANSIPSSSVQRHQPQPQLRSPGVQGTSAEAAAALTALHVGHTRPGPILPSQAMGPPMGLPTGQHRSRFSPERHANSPIRSASIASPITPVVEQRDEHLFADMAFGNPHGQSIRIVQAPEDVRWGSDVRFERGQGVFIPPSQRETTEALENEHLQYLRCFLPNSASTTQPSSPLANGNHSPVDGSHSRLNGRRVTKVKTEVEKDDEETAPALPKTAARKRKSKADLNGKEEASTLEDAPGKKRRKSNGAAKPPRENLTEEQKRENHIKSEQKRRSLIKEGYEDLQEIVPNLREGGYSKSVMLQMTTEWLLELISGNEQLSR